MKNKIKLPVLTALIVLAGVFFVSAYSDYEDDDEFNTLVITDFEGVGYIRDTTLYNVFINKIEIYPAGVTMYNRSKNPPIAGAAQNNGSVTLTISGGKITVTAYLYTYNNGRLSDTRWAGSGDYGVFLSFSYIKPFVIWDGRTVDGGNILRPDIPMTTGTTTISFKPLSEQ